jgi:L-fuculose-phosphate aldolase
MSAFGLKAEIVEIARRLYCRGLIGGNEGNVSARDGDVLYITPAGVCKGFLTPEQIVATDLQGRPTGGGRASTEVHMHTAVYRRRPDVKAVVHAHPPTATGFAVAGIPLDRAITAEAVVTLGPVPIIPYAMPSTADLADNVGQAICEAQAVLLAHHGALAVGDSLLRAWERMETLEQVARVALVARSLGREQELPGPDVRRLEAARSASGYPPPVCVDCPTCGTSVPVAGSDQVVLTRAELARVVAEAVERFSGTRS